MSNKITAIESPSDSATCDMQDFPSCYKKAGFYIGTDEDHEGDQWEHACEKHAFEKAEEVYDDQLKVLTKPNYFEICPLCNEKDIEYLFLAPQSENNTHIWVCPHCPFIGFEYWTDHNLKALENYIKNGKRCYECERPCMDPKETEALKRKLCEECFNAYRINK